VINLTALLSRCQYRVHSLPAMIKFDLGTFLSSASLLIFDVPVSFTQSCLLAPKTTQFGAFVPRP